MNEMKLVDRLRNPQTMSKFTGTADMCEELNLQRMHAADEIERMTAARDALRAEVEALRGQEPALYVQSNHFANAKFAPYLARICQQPMDQIHAVPLYLAAGAQGEPVVCEWREEDDFGWYTSCGATWPFFDGGPNDNGVKFCHGCGRSVRVALKP